jgi:hypothetical protein
MENLSKHGNLGSTMLADMNARTVKPSLTSMKALKQHSLYRGPNSNLSLRSWGAKSGEQRS